MLGGVDKDLYIQSSTQIVRPGRPTVSGPDMTGGAAGQCSAVIQEGFVVVTGGRRSGPGMGGSVMTEVYSFNSEAWTRKADMNQRRAFHSCTNVWLEPMPDPTISGVISAAVTNRSVLGVVVAGGKWLLY